MPLNSEGVLSKPTTKPDAFQAAFQSPDVKGLPVVPTKNEQDINKIAAEYEEMFLKFFFKNMLPENEDGFLGGSTNQVYRSIWLDGVAKEAAKKGSFGIAPLIARSLRKQSNAEAPQGGVAMTAADTINKMKAYQSLQATQAQSDHVRFA